MLKEKKQKLTWKKAGKVLIIYILVVKFSTCLFSFKFFKDIKLVVKKVLRIYDTHSETFLILIKNATYKILTSKFIETGGRFHFFFSAAPVLNKSISADI